MGEKPTIVRNPSGDAEFARAIEDVVASGAVDAQDAQQRLRAMYPSAVVRRRELEDERAEVWYAYRDGHWVRGD
jgi:hypothetical protein